jgi:ABC-type branched-subunit amino acid transport system substrate-binding protein
MADLFGVNDSLARSLRCLLGPALALSSVLCSCAPPTLDGSTWSCEKDSDCEDGKICAPVAEALGCVDVDTTPIKVGMSAPLQGPSQILGVEMRRGIQAMFTRVNAEGGVYGRPLELVPLNDNYDPEDAHKNMLELLDIQQEVADEDTPDRRGSDGVFAILGNVGTPTMLRTAPMATKNKVLFFAPFTGSQRYLRDGTNSPYVYNYRAGYYEETEAMVDYLANYRQPRVIANPAAESYRRIIAFTQHDAYGDAGYAGLTNAYNKISPLPQADSTLPDPSIRRVYYERDKLETVAAAVAETETALTEILGDGMALQSVAIVMIDTYQPGDTFIRSLKDWINQDEVRANMLDVQFMHVSFVGTDALAAALTSAPASYVDIRDGATKRSYAESVMVTQVVPYYGSQAVGISEYRADMAKSDGGPHSFTSLEGYIAARLFVTALELNGPTLSTESLLDTLNQRVNGVDVGIGTLLSFSSTNHQASHTVWASMIQANGTFEVPFTWDPTGHIRPN